MVTDKSLKNMRRRNASTGKQLCSMEGNADMRVKLEFQGERRIIPIARPVMIDQLQGKIKNTFGEDLGINFENGEVYIPIMKQSDLDKAIALLDQSPHLTSLRLTLTTKTITSDYTKHYTELRTYNDFQNGFLPDYKCDVTVAPDERASRKFDENDDLLHSKILRPLPVRSRSNPEELPSSPDEELMPPIRSHSMFIPPRDDALYGHSPPPGHHPDINLIHNHHDIHNGGGIFIPEDNNDVPETSFHEFTRPEAVTYGFDPLSPRENERQYGDPLSQIRHHQRLKESYDSLLGSSSPQSTSQMSIASEDPNYFRHRHNMNGERRRPLSDLIPDTVTLFEYDSDGSNSMKSEPYPKPKVRHKSDWNLNRDSVDSGGSYRWMDHYTNSFIPIKRTTSSSSTGQSSNSSGLVPDYDGSRVDRDLTDRIHKLAINTDIIFRWKQLRLLGAGAFGTVYLCVDLDTGKEMAMKCVETGAINTATLKEVEVLKREIQLYKTLKHERIVSYFGTWQDNRSISIFMEYMVGGSIHDKISKIGAFSEAEVSKYCRQILEGLAYLHSKNIIHRDIKGANILLDKSDNCKLADFGASRQIQTIRSKTGCKSVHGTPYWMSPEVINGEGYGRKADIWSLGCTAVEMLTTKPPWYQFEPMAALFKIATQPTHPHMPGDVTTSCSQFVEICFCRDPVTRPGASELLHYPFVRR